MISILATRLLLGARRQTGPLSKYLILPLFFLLGGVHAYPVLSPPQNPQHIYHYLQEKQEVVISGTLLKAPEIGPDKSRILLAAHRLILPTKTMPINGNIRLAMAGIPPTNLSPGDCIAVKAKISRPRNYGTPGSFDYEAFLAQKSIWADGWISSPELITKVSILPPSPTYTKIKYYPERIRQKINNFIDLTLPPATGGIYKAILTGDRASIPEETSENYRITGGIHLLAISGMHMGLLTLFLNALILWSLKRSERVMLRWQIIKAAALISMVPLAFYAFIAGFNIPVFRSLIMTYIFIGALVCNRQCSINNNIAIAALILLVINPQDIFTVSFQLSFAAIISIATIFPQIKNLLPDDFLFSDECTPNVQPKTLVLKKIYKFGQASLLISVAASIGTAPLLAAHFNRVSLLSPLTTLLIEPFICLWSLIIGLLACLSIPIPALADLLFRVGAFGIEISNLITATLAKIPFASLWLATPSITSITILYFIVFASIWAKNNFQHKITARTAIFTTLITIAVSFSLYSQLPKNTFYPTVSILDVGQGLAIVLELPNSKTFLLDGGKSQAGNKSSSNVGRDIIAPFLWKKKITRLDGIVFSHLHADHTNGAPFIIENFKPQAIWISKAQPQNDNFKSIKTMADKLNIPLKETSSGKVIYQDRQTSLQTLSQMHQKTSITPPNATRSRTIDASGNNASLVLRLSIDGHSFLFPGDIEKESEELLIDSGADLKADVLVAPHHGSITSSTQNFINKVQAKYVVVSAAAGQWGKFPSLKILTDYQEAGSLVLTTAKSGSVFFKIRENIELKTYY